MPRLNHTQTHEEAIMSRLAWGIRCACVVTPIVFFAGAASAQQRYQYSHSTAPTSSQYVQRHSVDVGDLPGHEIVIVEIQRIYASDPPMVMGVKVVESWSYGLTDQVNGVGPSQGYTTWKLEDGSKIFSEYHGSVHSELSSTGSRKGTYHGAARFIGGTGRFAAMRGTLTDDVEYDTDPQSGYNRPVSRGEYWFVR